MTGHHVFMEIRDGLVIMPLEDFQSAIAEATGSGSRDGHSKDARDRFVEAAHQHFETYGGSPRWSMGMLDAWMAIMDEEREARERRE